MTLKKKLGSHLLYLVLAILFFVTIQGVGRVSAASEIEFNTFQFQNAVSISSLDQATNTMRTITTPVNNSTTATQTDVDAAVTTLPVAKTSFDTTGITDGITFNVKDASSISKWDIRVFYRKDWSPSYFTYQELYNLDSNMNTYQSGSDYNVNIKNLDWNQSQRYYISIYARGNPANVLYKAEVTQGDEGSTIILQRDLSYTKFQVNIPSAGEGYIFNNIVLNDRDTKICFGSIDNNAYVKQGSYNLQVRAIDNVNNYNLFKTNIEVTGEIKTLEFGPDDMAKINFNLTNNTGLTFEFLHYFPHLEGFRTIYGGNSTDYLGKNLYLSKQSYGSISVNYSLGTEYRLEYDVLDQSEFIVDQDKTINLDTNLRLELNLDSLTYFAGQHIYSDMGGIYDGVGNKVGISDNNYQSLKGRLEFRKGTEVYNIDVDNLRYPNIILPNATGEFDVTFSLVDSPIAITPVTTKIRIGTSTYIPVTSVTLDKSSVTIMAGATEQLTANVAPSYATNQTILWSVVSQSTANVITVSEAGLVTAVNPGTAVIRATSNSDPTKYAECTVTVTAGVGTVLSATPLVQIGINPNYGDSAGIFVGLKDIRDTQGNLVPDAKLAGYQIILNYDHNLVSVLDLVNEGHLGNFTFNNILNSNKAIVADVVYDGTNNFEKLFFVPLALTGSSNNTTNVTIKFISLCDTNLNLISIPDVILTFQRGKILNEASQKPQSIVDAVAGLQYLAKMVDAGLAPGTVNVVNMASILLPEVGATSIKPSVKDVIALLQYLVELRDDHFVLVNQPPMQVNFGYHVRPGTTNGRQIEVYGLMDGDSVTLFKGSDPAQILDGPKEAVSGPEPKVVFDNVSFGNELYLNLHVERSTAGGVQTGNRTVFENLKVSTGVIRNGQNNTKDTDIIVSGLRSGDEVSLYKWGTEEQIQSTHTVDLNGNPEVFNGVDVIEEGIRIQFVRPGVSSSNRMHYRWGDLITYRVETQWETGGTYQASITGLVANDQVQLYSGTNLLTDITADGLSPVVLEGLNPQNTALQLKVIRNGIESHVRYLNPPPLEQPTSVNFGYHVRPGTTNGRQIEVYGLMDGDSVTLFKGSDPTQRLVDPKEAVSGPEPKVVFDNVSFGNELYLNLHVERSTPGGMQTGNRIVFENLKVSIGVIRNGQNNMKDTDLTVRGLHSGDEVSLYKWGTEEQIQSTHTVDLNGNLEVFYGVAVIEEGIRVQIVRPGVSTSERMHYRWGDLITFRVETQWETGGTYRASISGLVANDQVKLYSGSNLLNEQYADGSSPVVLEGLDPQNTALQFKVIRNGFESHEWHLKQW